MESLVSQSVRHCCQGQPLVYDSSLTDVSRCPDYFQHCRVRFDEKPVDQWSEQHFLHGASPSSQNLRLCLIAILQFATLICVFTLDRIGRRWTLYWGSVAQGIAMFLAGGFSRLAINAREAGDASKASSYGAAAASMIFIFTSVFGATWLTGTFNLQSSLTQNFR